MVDPPPVVMVFAATDPSGGAGIQADFITLSGLRCHAVSIVTALTVQDTHGIAGLFAIEPSWISDQANNIFGDMPVAVFKIGLLGSLGAVIAVSKIICAHPDIPVVFDPVLASGRGDQLASAEIISAMRELLIPRTTIITPNSAEAYRLANEGSNKATDSNLDECAQRLLTLGCRYVLVTGTHIDKPEVVNTLYGHNGIERRDSWERLPGSYHGSGCTLASAIAAYIANKHGVPDAVKEAQAYTWRTLKNAFLPGTGQYVPNRLV